MFSQIILITSIMLSLTKALYTPIAQPVASIAVPVATGPAALQYPLQYPLRAPAYVAPPEYNLLPRAPTMNHTPLFNPHADEAGKSSVYRPYDPFAPIDNTPVPASTPPPFRFNLPPVTNKVKSLSSPFYENYMPPPGHPNAYQQQ